MAGGTGLRVTVAPWQWFNPHYDTGAVRNKCNDVLGGGGGNARQRKECAELKAEGFQNKVSCAQGC